MLIFFLLKLHYVFKNTVTHAMLKSLDRYHTYNIL